MGKRKLKAGTKKDTKKDIAEDTVKDKVEGEADKTADSETTVTKRPTKKTKNVANDHEEFVNLYTSDESGGVVDMTTLERTSNRKNIIWGFILAILLLSAVAAGLGYMVFGPNRPAATTGEVTLDIETVSQIGSGDQIELAIHYTNASTAAIASGTVEVLFPQGFYFRSSDPQPRDASTNKWDIADIAAGTEGTITVTGQLVGQKDEEKEFTALLTYTPENFSSDFQQSAHATVTLDESIITLTTTVNDQARTRETLQHSFTFTNTSSLPLVNARAFVQYPAGFNATTANPTADKSDHTWLFDEIAPNETKEIIIEGDITAEGGTTMTMITQVGLEEPNGFFNIQTEASDDILIVNPEVSLSLTAPEFAAPGDTVTYDIVIENTSEVAIDGVDLVLDFTGEALDTTEVSLDTIDTLKPGEKVALTHTATVKKSLADDVTNIVAKLKIIGATVGGADVAFDQTAETTTALQGTLILNAEARYYDDDLTKLGSGPLPPQVGSTTNYVIRWTVGVDSGSMEDVKIQTTLPNGVKFVRASDNTMTHTDGTVTMQLDTLASGASQTSDFTISVTPTKNDKNKLLVLLNESVATALDSQSQQSIQAQAEQVTSKLTNDPGADDDGVVVGKSGE